MGRVSVGSYEFVISSAYCCLFYSLPSLMTCPWRYFLTVHLGRWGADCTLPPWQFCCHPVIYCQTWHLLRGRLVDACSGRWYTSNELTTNRSPHITREVLKSDCGCARSLAFCPGLTDSRHDAAVLAFDSVISSMSPTTEDMQGARIIEVRNDMLQERS